MSFSLIFFIIIQVAALIFFVETLRRVMKRSNEYEIDESGRTIPFGFVKLRYIIFFYIFSYVIWIALSVILYLFFIDTNSNYYYGNVNPPAQTQDIINLNL